MDIANNECIYECATADQMCSVATTDVNKNLIGNRACKKTTDTGAIATI